MVCHMLAASHYLQIFRTIIELIFVDMMRDFIVLQ
jgi:hypothetical protein